MNPLLTSGVSSSAPNDHPSTTEHISDLLIVVFVHGFKGNDGTFAGFPERLQHILSETISGVTVECLVFPAYETKGDLNEAVVRFADWLTTLTVEREVASGGGAGKAKIVLCGHSMGGLLIADTLLEFVNTRPDKTGPLWPRIIACIAFDTPYLGLHPHVFKNTITKATELATAAQTAGSALFGALAGFGAKKAATPTPSPQPAASQGTASAWKWAAPAAYAVGGAILAGAAAGGAYYKRDDINMGFAWATDHMKYVGNLWDEAALNRRLDALINVEEQEGVLFRTFYSLIPAVPPFSPSRTFVILPKTVSRPFSRFLPAKNGVAPDELQAHTGMFGAKTNDGYNELSLATSKIIQKSLEGIRGEVQTPKETTVPSVEPTLLQPPPPPPTAGGNSSDFANPWA